MREMEPRGIACMATAAIFESWTEERAEVDECSCLSGEEEAAAGVSSSSTTSSIGKNSDLSNNDENCEEEEENEVESSYKGTLEAMDSLEEALPMRRGISKFYNGKSKSFTSLAEASSSSTSCIKSIAKPENPYTRRRRNLLAFNHFWDNNTGRHRTFPHRSNGGGISKKPIITSSRSAFALAVAISSSSESISSISTDDSSSTSPHLLLPPHPHSRTCHGNLVASSESP